MKKAIFLTLSLLILLTGAGVTYAQNPTIGSKDDNACNAGGSMEGKCDSPWAWVCGYYLARWEAAGGWGAAGNTINVACASVLPPRPVGEVEAATASTTCLDLTGGSWFNFAADYFPIGIYQGYSDSNCTIPEAILTNFATAFATTTVQADAAIICIANGHIGTLGPQGDVYFCN